MRGYEVTPASRETGLVMADFAPAELAMFPLESHAAARRRSAVAHLWFPLRGAGPPHGHRDPRLVL